MTDEEFWGKKVNVSREAAAMQVAIYRTFSSEKRFQMALDVANMGIKNTRAWIKRNNPHFCEEEISLEFVRLMSYEMGKIDEAHWQHFKKGMEKRIRQHWATRFRNMMAHYDWTYEEVAKKVGFKNGKVLEATISRGLPTFAKLAVLVFEESVMGNE